LSHDQIDQLRQINEALVDHLGPDRPTS